MIAFYFHSGQGRCECVKIPILSLVTGPPTGRIYLHLASLEGAEVVKKRERCRETALNILEEPEVQSQAFPCPSQ